MKTFGYFMLIALCSIICACRKTTTTGYTPPISIYFELTDNNGNSLVKSLNDSVKVGYTQDGAVKYHNLTVEKLRVAYNDTTTVKYYNGLVIDDYRFITDLSADNVNPVRNFTIYLNHMALGNLYFDYKNLLLDNPVAAPVKSVTFNNIPCKLDASFNYFSPGIGIMVLPTQ